MCVLVIIINTIIIIIKKARSSLKMLKVYQIEVEVELVVNLIYIFHVC